jgi:hypothetical protein
VHLVTAAAGAGAGQDERRDEITFGALDGLARELFMLGQPLGIGWGSTDPLRIRVR